VIQNGQSGYLVPPGNDTAFVSAMTSLLTNTTQLKVMSSFAAQDMKKRFSWEILAKTAVKAYTFAIDTYRER
jgi:glycosyltransferase involved in cell wall biosynthesis